MTNSADPDQKPTDLDLHSSQRQGISGFSRTRVNILIRDNTLHLFTLTKNVCFRTRSSPGGSPLLRYVRSKDKKEQMIIVSICMSCGN